MKLLFNHVSKFKYRATEKTKIGKGIGEDEKSGETEEALLIKICSESGDDDSTIERALEEIEDVSDQIGVEIFVLFPWAHLSQDLASPETAEEMMEELKNRLESEGFEVLKAPFGWYKEWELESKGHPISVLSRAV
ncbi:hypothetical protein AKJ51_05190 [candidate division MSBL1 archaeon SCGC-AAA382A20]|uniref:Threonyl-tRNA synthetase editing domain-containing protein n=1 Tax=candidate division MSBL1 archaeon SCGC-AAA382A20 TaxID=1698280 RepID=A0A133VFR1_9EURY|nr:hypothetical protein AKJ51_05190 [candidate division MSBL1 archaeon SCGC-AAA382A20]